MVEEVSGDYSRLSKTDAEWYDLSEDGIRSVL